MPAQPASPTGKTAPSPAVHRAWLLSRGPAAVLAAAGLGLLLAAENASPQTAPPPGGANGQLQPTIAAPGVLNYLSQRTGTQRLATSYIGKNVFGADGERIGDVNDVVVDTQPAGVAAIVIGVGGFLGLGEKDVAVPLGAVRLERIDGVQRLVMSVTREDLRKAPTFVRGDPLQ